jgi:putative membrane protein
MTTTQGDLAALSRYIFRAPQWYASLGFALLIAAVAGIAAFDSRFVLEDAWQGVFFIGVPTIAASVLTPPVDRYLGGQLTPNRASLLALVSELILVAFLVGAGVVAVLTPLGQRFVFAALTVGLASVFALRLLVVLAISRKSLPIAAIPASVQTAAVALLVFIYSGTMRFFEVGGPVVRSFLSRPSRGPAEFAAVEPLDFALLAVMCAIYAGGVWAFVTVIDQPWQRSLGVSVLDFLRGFIGHIADGTREIEEFFATLGEEALVPVTVLSARRPDGTEKARFVLPMIHPGPMGEIGGGGLPKRVAESTDGLGFPPHATAGHDFNLVSEREVDTVLDAVSRASERIDYGKTGSASRRATVGEATVTGHAVGDGALLVATYAPSFADDIDYSVGLSAAAEARAHGLDEAMLVDAHNSNNGLEGPDLGHVVPGSQRSFDLIEAVGEVADDLARAPREPLSLGVAWDETPWTPAEGIGPLGVRVAVFAAGEETTAYVLIDGNNMEPGLREAIVGRLDAVDTAEVMTSDTHVVNTLESTNQVGDAIAHDDLIERIETLVEQALDDCEPVETGMATERARVTVFGNDRTETLASHANAMVTMGGALAGAVVLALFAISVLVFFFI